MKKVMIIALMAGLCISFSHQAEAQAAKYARTAYKWASRANTAYKVYKLYDSYTNSSISCDNVYDKLQYYYAEYSRLNELAYYYYGTQDAYYYQQQAKNAYNRALHYERLLSQCR